MNMLTDEQALAEMRRQYPYATLEAHMLVDGVIYLRCGRCKARPVPYHWQHFMWCEECLAMPIYQGSQTG